MVRDERVVLTVVGGGQVLLAVDYGVYAKVFEYPHNPRQAIGILVSQKYLVNLILMYYLLQIVDEKAWYIAVAVANLGVKNGFYVYHQWFCRWCVWSHCLWMLSHAVRRKHCEAPPTYIRAFDKNMCKVTIKYRIMQIKAKKVLIRVAAKHFLSIMCLKGAPL